jgi:hypothetical protein
MIESLRKDVKIMAMNRVLPRAGALALVCSLIGLGARAENPQPLPAPFPEVRYQQMCAKSPFAVATAAATAAPTPGFATHLYVGATWRALGKDWVAIKDRESQQAPPICLEVGTTGTDGMRVEAVHWSEATARTTVDVSKNGEKFTLAFDEELMKEGTPPLAVPRQPGFSPNNPFNRNRMFPQIPGQPPQTRRRPVIPSGP